MSDSKIKNLNLSKTKTVPSSETISTSGGKPKTHWWKNMNLYVRILIIAIIIVIVGGVIYFVVELIKNIDKAGKNILGPVIDLLGSITKDIKQCTTKSVVNIIITNNGKGYTSSPKITISGGGGKSGENEPPSTEATAVTLIKNGQVTSIRITETGAGYVSTPTVSISGGGKPTTNATATATVDGGPFSSVGCSLFLFAGVGLFLAFISKLVTKRTKTSESLEFEKSGSAESLAEAWEAQTTNDAQNERKSQGEEAAENFKDKVKDATKEQIDAVKEATMENVKSETAIAKYKELASAKAGKVSQKEVDETVKNIRENSKKIQKDILDKAELSDEAREIAENEVNDSGESVTPEVEASEYGLSSSSTPCSEIQGITPNTGCCGNPPYLGNSYKCKLFSN